MILTATSGGKYELHPEGIWLATCLDVIDMGNVRTSFQGVEKIQPKVRLVFETGQTGAEGQLLIVTHTVTASLHPKSELHALLSKWRGKPIGEHESIDMNKLIGACCTLVLSHQKSKRGKDFVAIDAISKPTGKLAPSGKYDPAAYRAKIAEWNARDAARNGTVAAPATMAPGISNGGQKVESGSQPGNVSGGTPNTTGGTPVPPAAPTPADDDVPF